MSNVQHVLSTFMEGKQQGIKIKNEILDIETDVLPSTSSNELIANCNHSNDTKLFCDEKMSCVYNSQSPATKTILITNNYSQAGNNKQNIVTNNNINNSSITIFTHNSDSEGKAANIVPTSPHKTVILDRINILINNHFNEPPSATISSSNITTETTTEAPTKDPPFSKDNDKFVTNIIAKESNNIIPISSTTTIKEINHPQQPLKIETFSLDEDVLVFEDDDRYYLGKIIDSEPHQCLVKFSDNIERWSPLSKISIFNTSDGILVCVICKQHDDLTDVENCVKCGRGYHTKCTEIINGMWFCRRGHRNLLKDPNINLDNVNSLVKELPYNLDSLTWDKSHRVNCENIYCYCGYSGDWYMQMLQCARCRQWFHEKCVQNLHYPLYCGDR